MKKWIFIAKKWGIVVTGLKSKQLEKDLIRNKKGR
jgi:hypothetical protein